MLVGYLRRSCYFLFLNKNEWRRLDINVLSYLANSTWSRITIGNRKIVVFFSASILTSYLEKVRIILATVQCHGLGKAIFISSNPCAVITITAETLSPSKYCWMKVLLMPQGTHV